MRILRQITLKSDEAALFERLHAHMATFWPTTPTETEVVSEALKAYAKAELGEGKDD